MDRTALEYSIDIPHIPKMENSNNLEFNDCELSDTFFEEDSYSGSYVEHPSNEDCTYVRIPHLSVYVSDEEKDLINNSVKSMFPTPHQHVKDTVKDCLSKGLAFKNRHVSMKSTSCTIPSTIKPVPLKNIAHLFCPFDHHGQKMHMENGVPQHQDTVMRHERHSDQDLDVPCELFEDATFCDSFSSSKEALSLLNEENGNSTRQNVRRDHLAFLDLQDNLFDSSSNSSFEGFSKNFQNRSSYDDASYSPSKRKLQAPCTAKSTITSPTVLMSKLLATAGLISPEIVFFDDIIDKVIDLPRSLDKRSSDAISYEKLFPGIKENNCSVVIDKCAIHNYTKTWSTNHSLPIMGKTNNKSLVKLSGNTSQNSGSSNSSSTTSTTTTKNPSNELINDQNKKFKYTKRRLLYTNAEREVLLFSSLYSRTSTFHLNKTIFEKFCHIIKNFRHFNMWKDIPLERIFQHSRYILESTSKEHIQNTQKLVDKTVEKEGKRVATIL